MSRLQICRIETWFMPDKAQIVRNPATQSQQKKRGKRAIRINAGEVIDGRHFDAAELIFDHCTRLLALH